MRQKTRLEELVEVLAGTADDEVKRRVAEDLEDNDGQLLRAFQTLARQGPVDIDWLALLAKTIQQAQDCENAGG